MSGSIQQNYEALIAADEPMPTLADVQWECDAAIRLALNNRLLTPWRRFQDIFQAAVRAMAAEITGDGLHDWDVAIDMYNELDEAMGPRHNWLERAKGELAKQHTEVNDHARTDP